MSSRKYSVARPTLGASVEWNSNTLPWWGLWEDGSAVSRTTYAALFAVIGTQFGPGDGSTTFNLPDSRGRAARARDNQGGVAANRLTAGGSGITGSTLGAAGGAETATAPLPNHAHNLNTGTTIKAIRAGSGSNDYQTAGSGTGSGVFDQPSGTDAQGPGGAHQNTAPTIVKNKVICWAP